MSWSSVLLPNESSKIPPAPATPSSTTTDKSDKDYTQNSPLLSLLIEYLHITNLEESSYPIQDLTHEKLMSVLHMNIEHFSPGLLGEKHSYWSLYMRLYRFKLWAQTECERRMCYHTTGISYDILAIPAIKHFMSLQWPAEGSTRAIEEMKFLETCDIATLGKIMDRQTTYSRSMVSSYMGMEIIFLKQVSLITWILAIVNHHLRTSPAIAASMTSTKSMYLQCIPPDILCHIQQKISLAETALFPPLMFLKEDLNDFSRQYSSMKTSKLSRGCKIQAFEFALYDQLDLLSVDQLYFLAHIDVWKSFSFNPYCTLAQIMQIRHSAFVKLFPRMPSLPLSAVHPVAFI